MPLLSDADREQVHSFLSRMTNHVVLRFYTQAIGCETCPQTRQVLDALVELGDGRVSIDERNLVLDVSEQDEGVDRTPTVWVMSKSADDEEQDEGIHFVGAPLGYEFTSLLDAILLVSTRESGLSDASFELLKQVTTPMDIQVFTTPTCSHCSQAVSLAQRMAIASPLITATAVAIVEFPDLVQRYNVRGVPKTVVDDQVEILGGLPEAEFVPQVLQLRLAQR